MTKSEKVIDAFRNCITEPKCKDCPWESCEQFNKKHTEIPLDLALDVNNLLQRHRAAEAEIEGGGHTWFFVCGECHGAIDSNDKYCRHCGREIIWA